MSDDDVRGGYPVRGHHPERNGGLLPENSENSTLPALPTDLAAVQADDALLDALCGPNSSPEGSDARLTQVLLAWRHEVDTEPVIQVVDTDTALAVVARARRPEPRRKPVLVPFAAAAAVLVIAFSGVGVGARAAEPGDRLFPLAKVLFTEDAESKEAATEAEAQLEWASEALDQGRPDAAQTALDRVEYQLQVVDDEESRAELEGKAEELRVELGRPGTGDGVGSPSSGKSDPAPEQDVPPAVEPTTAQEAPTSEEMLESPAEPEQPGPADPGPGGASGTGGEGPASAPRSAPSPEAAAPVAPVPPAPPEASPES